MNYIPYHLGFVIPFVNYLVDVFTIWCVPVSELRLPLEECVVYRACLLTCDLRINKKKKKKFNC
jgi:hypothetical protein